MSESKGKDSKKQAIKDLIKELHVGARPKEVKEKFKKALGGIGAADIARIEGELIEEGMPAEEVRRLCDVHLAVFQDTLKEKETLASPGHPIHTFMEEHKILLQLADKLKNVAEKIKGAEGFAAAGEPASQAVSAGSKVLLETGGFLIEELEAILNTLPVDITFVDKEDRVRYFSQSQERIFPRTKAVIGRKVQQCHPQESLHVVEEILNDFRKNKRNKAEFWISLKKRLIYIRYFAVRGKNKEYLGCLEVTQDITGIKGIEGEKRLL